LIGVTDVDVGLAEADGDGEAVGVGSSVGLVDGEAAGEPHPAIRVTMNKAETAVRMLMLPSLERKRDILVL